MIVQSFKCGFLHNNNYLLIDEKSKEAILIDCTEENQDIVDFIDKNGLHLKYILLTHGHFDHVLGAEFFQKKYNAPAYLYEKDQEILGKINLFMDLVQLPHRNPPQITHFFKSNDTFTLGKDKISIIPTSGHSMGSVCFLIQNKLFSGDTLFRGAYGRTDCWGGNQELIQKSLKMLFNKLPDDTEVYPGHGAPTTIGKERDLYQNLLDS